MSAAVSESASTAGRRMKLLALVLGVFVIGGIAFGAYWLLVGRYAESTDNAYVSGNVVQIMPQVAGTVVAIDADDTDFVKAGQILVELDKADSRVALDEAEAQLAKTVRQVRNLMATSAQLEANVTEKETILARARADLDRRDGLARSGALSREELQHARDAVANASAAYSAARQQLAAARALVDGTSVDSHPDVQAASAKLREAYLAFSRTALPAPVSGFVAKRSVQVGQRVTPGSALMTVIPLDQVWVDANFKEGQIANLRVGQPVTVTADVYGSAVKYTGRVAGFSAGTGGAFALLPAQNATGNWIKIVQRVPVRITLDPKELAAHPLQIGLSMQVAVDTHDRAGDQLPKAAHTAQAYQTDAFQSLDALADARVKAIVAANTRAPMATPREARLDRDKAVRSAKSL